MTIKDYFTDERMWATHRTRWKIKQWWLKKRLLLLAALIMVVWLLSVYYDEREKRHVAEAQVDNLVHTLVNAPCYGEPAPASLLLVGGSQEDLYKGLLTASTMADHVRQGWLIARDKGKK